MAGALTEIIQLERSILGRLLLHGNLETIKAIEPLLKDIQFVDQNHQRIFEAILRSLEENSACSPILVMTLLDDRTSKVLQSITERTISLDGTPDIDALVASIKRHKLLTKIRQLHQEIDRFLRFEATELDEFIANLSSSVSMLSEPDEAAQDEVDTYLQELKSILIAEEPKPITGIKRLDWILHPILPGDLVVVAGRTSIGKTMFALQMAVNLAMMGEKVMFVSLEMTRPQIVIRLFAHLAFVSVRKIFQPGLLVYTEGEGANRKIFLTREGYKIANAYALLRRLPLLIVDGTKIAESFSVARLTSEIILHKPKWVFIDYLHLMEMPTDDASISPAGINKLVRDIKAIALRFKIPIVALSQINRQAEMDKVSLENLYYSSGIAHTASQVIILRERKSSDRQSDLREIEVSVEKNRHGKTGAVSAVFIRPLMRFAAAEIAEGE